MTDRSTTCRFTWLAVLACLPLLVPAAPDKALVEVMEESLGRVVSDVDVKSVKESVLPGLYEVVVGANVVYLSRDGRYFLQGDLIDLEERVNITENKRSDARVAALEALEPADIIEFGPADAQNVIYVFTDIDCGYCRRMHKEVDQLNDAGIAVRYLSFPRSGIGSESYDKMVSVFCSEDRQQALTDAKAGKRIPEASCENPVAEQYKLGESMGVNGTPAVYLENGREIGGYIPAKRLIEFFETSGPNAS